MPATKQSSGITFEVDQVEPATKLLPECKTHEALKRLLGGIESCHDYHGTVVKNIDYQPLLAAVYIAFSEHRPLVLTPDAVWLTIAQGVAHHMAIHGDRLRSRFVSHQGKLRLVFTFNDWIEGSPENPWPLAFESWAAQIREHVGPELHDALLCDFSTTAPVERTVSQIVMMDVFERYFHYVAYGICGIPTVTLEGTVDDWQRIKEKVAFLRKFDIDWWLDHVEPICEQFVDASQGKPDKNHWQRICKLKEAYGGHIINGWIAKLFPYRRAFIGGPCNRRNPIFETGEGFQTFDAPSGLSRVPFTWINARTNRTRKMEVIGGLVGVTQDPDTLAFRPKVGWAVRKAEKLDVCLARLKDEHKTFPSLRTHRIEEGNRIGGTGLPADLSRFYHETDGAELFGEDTMARFRVLPREQIKWLDWGENPKAIGSYGPDGRIWHRFVLLPDDTWLAINLDPNIQNAAWASIHDARNVQRSIGYETFAPICHTSAVTANRPGMNPVIALSFGELLEKLLDSGGRPFWREPNFVGYGDAEMYTRRK